MKRRIIVAVAIIGAIVAVLRLRPVLMEYRHEVVTSDSSVRSRIIEVGAEDAAARQRAYDAATRYHAK